MRSICLVSVEGKLRPALVLTAEGKREHAVRLSVVPISSTIRGSNTEVVVGPSEGLDHRSVIKCENIRTVAATDVVREIGLLPSGRERELRRAIVVAFDLLPLGVA